MRFPFHSKHDTTCRDTLCLVNECCRTHTVHTKCRYYIKLASRTNAINKYALNILSTIRHNILAKKKHTEHTMATVSHSLCILSQNLRRPERLRDSICTTDLTFSQKFSSRIEKRWWRNLKKICPMKKYRKVQWKNVSSKERDHQLAKFRKRVQIKVLPNTVVMHSACVNDGRAHSHTERERATGEWNVCDICCDYVCVDILRDDQRTMALLAIDYFFIHNPYCFWCL